MREPVLTLSSPMIRMFAEGGGRDSGHADEGHCTTHSLKQHWRRTRQHQQANPRVRPDETVSNSLKPHCTTPTSLPGQPPPKSSESENVEHGYDQYINLELLI